MTEQLDRPKLAEMTAEIVSAYVSHNQVLPADLPNLIGSIAGKLATLGSEEEQAAQRSPSRSFRCADRSAEITLLA